MRQVFTLWPHDSEVAEQQISEDGFPMWARIKDSAPLPVYWPWHLFIGSAVLIALVIAAAAMPASHASMIVAGVAGFFVLAHAYMHFVLVTRLRRELDTANRWNQTLFHRSGIALWREDWTAARNEVLAILHSGERDMLAFFSKNPEKLREIRSKVIIKDVNEAGIQRSGKLSKSELLGPLDRILPDTDHTFVQWLVAFSRGDTLYRSETHLTMPSGVTMDTLFSAALPRDMRGFEDILVSDLDITHYKAAQDRLARAEVEIMRAARISTMGALTASIAHEINSPLAAIIASSEAALRWLRRDYPDIDEAVSAMQTVNEQAVRAQAVVERTRAYVNHSPIATTERAIEPLICDAIQLIQRDLRELHAATHLDIPESLPNVLVDAVHIQQVLINLIMNGAQAMRGRDGPKDISIQARVEKRMVVVSITDSGGGINPALVQDIFEPFYSTKPDGMGMGLAICRTCIAAHGGQIWVSNRPGEGATFHFSLPIAQA